jgi:hypothetical protein
MFNEPFRLENDNYSSIKIVPIVWHVSAGKPYRPCPDVPE